MSATCSPASASGSAKESSNGPRVSAEAARPTERLRLAVDPARFHFFDPETGAIAGASADAAVAAR